MLQGYSHMAVAGIIAATLTAFLHLRSSSPPSIADETQEAFEALGTSLRAVFAQWEKDVLPKTNQSYQLAFRTLESVVLELVRHQEQFGPTPPRAN